MLQVSSKYKICKRLGSGVFEKCQNQKFTLSEARSRKASGRGRQLSDFGKQLIEKQKMRYTYGLSEQQFGRYVREAMASGTQPAAALHTTLETRLDNVAYRLGFATTRRAARQMASHGHLTVNGRRMNVPSHTVRVGDVIAVREGSKTSSLFTVLSEREDAPAVPAWLSADIKSLSASVTALPSYTPGEDGLDYGSVLEFYSR
jgi:small subunit ribosomal protein S4